MPFQPITNAVVIRPEQDQNRDGILYTPTLGTPRQGTLRGVVVSVGEGRLRKKRFLHDPTRGEPQYIGAAGAIVDPLEVQPGDRVLYQTWEGTGGASDRHFVDGEWLDILAEEFVMAVIE